MDSIANQKYKGVHEVKQQYGERTQSNSSHY